MRLSGRSLFLGEQEGTVSFLFDFGIIKLLAVVVVITGGIFVAVVLGGLLSALVTLGALELGLRARIHKNALVDYLERSRLPAEIRDFMTFRYKNRPGVEFAHFTDLVRDHDAKGVLLPIAAQMEPNSFYRLYYQQICGQLVAVVNNEALLKTAGQVFAPLTDLLLCVASSRNTALRFNGLISKEDEDERSARAELDLVLREIDNIQAELGSSISKATFPVTVAVWILIYGPILVMAAIYLPFSYSGSVLGFTSTLVQHFLITAVALLGGIALSLGSAVFGSVAFSWLDRVLASK
jgi:hypothetical protein